mmetsp:Transcript_27864/g.80486  ORF Transcript_27864/g.80486 Transcript_27864/m.80486 type:complete len:297 (+) Transcript_27864:113-1003(+)
MIGPVFQLRYLGLICPCLEKPEDEAARGALQMCTGLPVRYHRKTTDGGGENTLSSAMSSVSGLFGGGGGSGGGDDGSGGTSFVKGPATLTLMDTLSGPAIFVETEPDVSAESTEVDEEGNVLQLDTRHRKTVPLRKIAKIKAVDGTFMGMIGGGPSLVAVIGKAKGSPELLRFNVLNALGKKVENAEFRDEVIGRLDGLVEWDRRRRAGAGGDDGADNNENDDNEEEEFENDEESRGGKKKGAPKGRAAKAAYFAKREIELTKQRREREKRKARYLEGSGGLKYTAIAMANKAEIT